MSISKNQLPGISQSKSVLIVLIALPSIVVKSNTCPTIHFLECKGTFINLNTKMALNGKIGACTAPCYFLQKRYKRNPMTKNGVRNPRVYQSPSPRIITLLIILISLPHPFWTIIALISIKIHS